MASNFGRKALVIGSLGVAMGVGAVIMRAVDPSSHSLGAAWAFVRTAALTILVFTTSAGLPALVLPGGWRRFPAVAWAIYGIGVGIFLAWVLPLSFWGQATPDFRIIAGVIVVTMGFFAWVGPVFAKLRNDLDDAKSQAAS